MECRLGGWPPSEDRRYGDRRDDLPEELRFHRSRLAKLREAKRALEDEAKESSSSKQDDDDDDKLNGDPPSDDVDEVKPDDKVQRNFTDPDSRIMKAPGKHQFIQGYNVQIAVDAETQVILATHVHQSSSDTRSFIPILDNIESNVGRPLRVTADAAYLSEENVTESRRRKIAPFIPPDFVKLRSARPDYSDGLLGSFSGCFESLLSQVCASQRYTLRKVHIAFVYRPQFSVSVPIALALSYVV